MFFDSKAREERRGEGGELASSHERRKRRFDRNSKFSLENFLFRFDSNRSFFLFFFFLPQLSTAIYLSRLAPRNFFPHAFASADKRVFSGQKEFDPRMQKYRFQASRTKFHSIVSIRKSNSINKKVPTDYFRRKIFFHFQNPRNESKLFQCSEFKILLISFEKEDPCKYYRIRELFVDAKGLETFCGWLHCTFGLIMP